MYDVVIVGAGVAGMTAAIYARRAGRSVLVLEEKAYGGQILESLKVENWPGEVAISGPDLMGKIYHQVNNLGVEVRYESVLKVDDATGPVLAVSPTSLRSAGAPPARPPVASSSLFTVKTDEAEYSCGAIILAMGTKPRELSKKQAKEAGDRAISYCATCDGALYRGKPVVVIGSGNTAKYEIQYLEQITSKVYHIHHDDPIPEEAVAIFVATKRVPNTGFLGDLVELDKDGYVVAGEDCKTSRPGVLVAGDCRTKQVRQLVTAAGDGAVAAGAAGQFLA